MMHDYWMRQPDIGVVKRNLHKAQRVLDWYAPHVASNGLFTRNPGWNFVDWVGDPPMARDAFPSFDKASNTSCLTSLIYLGALREAADMEFALGQAPLAQPHLDQASRLSSAIEQKCWDAKRQLYADDPSHAVYSQHTNALAVLYDVAGPAKAQDIVARIVGKQGIDPPSGILATSYYFAWYLNRAIVHAGLGDRYIDLLSTWRGLDAPNFTTWPEARGNTRSDSHAWSAHPTAGLLGLVAGIQPAAPGYGQVRIAPHPGFDVAAATPSGLVRVRYAANADRRTFKITMPKRLAGDFVWQSANRKLKPGTNTFSVEAK